MYDTAEDVLAIDFVAEARNRGIIAIKGNRITYTLAHEKSYSWMDPEEWVRAATISWLIIERGYPASRIKTEVVVPRRTPNDLADIVVFRDDACRDPYLVVENKATGQTGRDRDQAIEQAFGNANSLRAPLCLYDEGDVSILYDVANHPPIERHLNRLGNRSVLPSQYGDIPVYQHIAGAAGDIEPLPPYPLESRIRAAHSAIWSGGKRDPLTAFDEWSKLLFAKVADERTTPTGQPRQFQIGTNETTATVANRIHALFRQACAADPTIFPAGTRINLTDSKIAQVVRILQGISFIRTDIDSIGTAFEQFFGSIFRGELGQYFTMRQLARFVVAILDITHEDFVLDPTSGSGGFLLETLLQVWHRIDNDFRGQPAEHIQRLKIDFALGHVFGIEIHDVLARICKINLLLHHDGHTNIEANRSCLDSNFSVQRLNPQVARFTRIVGNPPFGTTIAENDEEQLGTTQLADFKIAAGLRQIESEQIIIERSINWLEPGGRLGLILPDGLFNNQGWRSNCPQTRALIARSGRILAVISLPDHAFRKSGAQNKTSILFFEKFSDAEKRHLDRTLARLVEDGRDPTEAIADAIEQSGLTYKVFLGEANHVGYSTTGVQIVANDLFRGEAGGAIDHNLEGTILGEWRRFTAAPDAYTGSTQPDCMALSFPDVWRSHGSHRLDPKYHLFKREEARVLPEGWVHRTLGQVMHRREDVVDFAADPDRLYTVMTISQTGEIRARQAGKGKNYPEWRGTYFLDSSGTWFYAEAGDVVFSSIDLWKGCIAVVPDEFHGAIVTKEFPIYRVRDERLSPTFLQALLRSRYYQRAFRAITTGHSNRRRTQIADFEALEIAFPESRDEQDRLVAPILTARNTLATASESLKEALLSFSDVIDGRGDEELPEISDEFTSEEEI